MIIISPYSRKLVSNNPNPKNYPYWRELIAMIKEPIVQVGVTGEEQLVRDIRFDLNLEDLGKLVGQCRTWISVDSFFQHFCWDLGKPGIVLWGQSDPLIYGHHENINLLKNRDYLLQNQFLFWELVPYRVDCFVDPREVMRHL